MKRDDFIIVLISLAALAGLAELLLSMARYAAP
jgi:hypothetical protein